jgi:hypothetical protein
MGTYEITSPDGQVFEVTAPDGASEQEVLSYAQSQFTAQEATPEKDTSFLDKAKAVGAGALDMATFGFSDEIQAGIAAELARERAQMGDVPIQDMGDLYGQAVSEIRGERDVLQEQNKGAYLGGQLVGGLGTGMAMLPKSAAGLISKGLTGGKLAKYGTSAGLGGVSGGVYGLGSGEGAAKERAPQAASGGLFGIAGGVGGTAIGGLAQRAIKAFSKKTPKIAREVTDEVLPISGRPAQEVVDLTTDTPATTMIKGAQTQDVPLMRQEELARQGLLGSELESSVRAADTAFKQSVKDTAQALAGTGTKETAEDTLTSAVGLVKDRFKAEKVLQGKLMTARNNAISKASVYKDYTKDTLLKSMNNLKKSDDFKVNLMRENMKPIADDFKILSKMVSPKQVKSINMSALGAWRSGLNNYRAGTQESVFAGKMAKVYDQWLDDHLKLAIKEGDDDLADKIFGANKRYAEFKGKYGTDKYKGQKAVIEKILREDEMTPRAMVNTVFGKSLDGKDYTEQYVKRMVDAMPEGAQRVRVQDGFRAGLFQKAFEDSYDDVGDVINLGKFKTNLIKMGKNNAYKKYLATPEHDMMRNSLIEDLGKFQRATSDRSIVNVSGTTPMAARIMQGFGSIPIIRNMPLARGVSEGISNTAKQGAKASDKRAVEKSLADFYKTLSPEIDNNIKFMFPSAPITGGELAAERDK